MDFDGLKTDIISMLSGSKAEVDTHFFQNDMVTFECKDDVLTLLIHLGYLAYDQDEQVAFIPNEEVRQEFISATKHDKWSELNKFEMQSDSLLRATLDLDADAVASGIEKIHCEYTSIIKYNDGELTEQRPDAGLPQLYEMVFQTRARDADRQRLR